MNGLAADHDFCAELLGRSGSSFALPIRLLPAAKRRGTTALYAFCRRADDIVDGAGDGARSAAPAALDRRDATAALDAFAADLEAALAGGRSGDPVIRALVDTVRRFAVPPEHLRAVLDGVRMDLVPPPFPGVPVAVPDVAALELYCARVASAVGLAAIHIWGFTSPEAIPAGHACGLAFQLTNILRDIPEDLGRGRMYLPNCDFMAAGCTLEDLVGGRIGPGFDRLAALEVARADGWYRQARRLDRLLSTDGRIVFRAMYGAYRTIFHAVRRRGPAIFQARVSPPKPLLAGAALAAVVIGPRGLCPPW
jgi:phytoene synthase